mmetsp:Transcript_16582/g.62747  ORF Transcript_16582/g.62747 Transcript_16582/m.62747 type:complete len:233 (+) Transcript_16582:4408-5106(+)
MSPPRPARPPGRSAVPTPQPRESPLRPGSTPRRSGTPPPKRRAARLSPRCPTQPASATGLTRRLRQPASRAPPPAAGRGCRPRAPPLTRLPAHCTAPPRSAQTDLQTERPRPLLPRPQPVCAAWQPLLRVTGSRPPWPSEIATANALPRPPAWRWTQKRSVRPRTCLSATQTAAEGAPAALQLRTTQPRPSQRPSGPPRRRQSRAGSPRPLSRPALAAWGVRTAATRRARTG